MKKKFQLENIVTISAAHLIHDINSAFLAPILPLLIQKLGISLSLAGLLDVVRRLPSLLNPLVGIMADKICVRYFIIIAPFITGLSMSLLGLAPSYSVLVIMLLVAGISSALFHVPAPVMIKNISGKRIGKGMSFYMLGGELARTLGPLIITTAVSWWGLEGTFRLIPISLTASIVLYIRFKDVKVDDKQLKRKKKTHPGATLKKLLPFFFTISGILFFRAAIKSSLTIFLPTYLSGKGESFFFAGISLSVLQFAGAAGTFLAGTISDKIGRKPALLIISIFNPILMWLFIIFNSGALMLPLLLLMGFILFASGPVLLALVQDTDSEHPAFVNGIYMTINFALGSLLVLLIGILGDSIGLEDTYKICATISLGSIPFVLMLPNPNRKTEKE
ncbi:MAG: MFS transporter [Candidatus Cloacimonadota bacterium]|nr:MFS transporter [Candidatus Cloacimonadota bacterium]